MHCRECATILRELQIAWREDYGKVRERVREEWLESGLGLRQFYQSYLSRQMDQLSTESQSAQTLDAQFQNVSELRRKASEHELLTGHRIWRDSGFGGGFASFYR